MADIPLTWASNDQIIVEFTVAGALSDMHVRQRRNYLRATGKALGLPTNFGQTKVDLRRITAQARSRRHPVNRRLSR
ncbi:MAG TPA: GxxExxY protein [Rhodopila sp.]|nr:GxxExxY protein [Rhodopila sp.]